MNSISIKFPLKNFKERFVCITFSQEKILGIGMSDSEQNSFSQYSKQFPFFVSLAMTELQTYFSGKNLQFSFFEYLDFQKYSDFQRKVWLHMFENLIYGTTKTYRQLSIEIFGNENYSRAIGNACASNPYLFIIPCHRVVAYNGIGNFSGGDGVKKALLTLENKMQNDFAEFNFHK